MSAFLDVNESKTAYHLTGTGPPLLLIHGSGADRHMFDPIEPLLASHFLVISYDQRDCGETENSPADADLDQLALDARLLVEALGQPRVHVFGSSFGGRVAQALAILYPTSVDRLILGSTWPLSVAFKEANPEGSQRMAALRSGLPGTARELARWFFPATFLNQSPEFLDYFNSSPAASERSIRRAQTVSGRLDARLSQIAARTLLLVGDMDVIVPAEVTLDMAEQIRDCQQLVLKDVGHATCLQAPEQVAHAITHFIKGDLSSPARPKESIS